MTTATPGPTKSDEFTVPMKLREALELLLARRETPQDDAVYIKTWDYVHGPFSLSCLMLSFLSVITFVWLLIHTVADSLIL